MDPNLKKKGLVKGVPTADRVIFQGPPNKDGIPLEKTIHLIGLKAPTVSDPERQVREEPYGFQAREYLRNKLIGKQVFFYTEAKVGDKEYGRIIVDDVDVAEGLLAEGYVRLVDDFKPEPANYAKYETIADKAYHSKRGVYATDNKILNANTRKLAKIDDLVGFVEKHKNKPLKGIVEEFRGNLFTVYLTEQESVVKVALHAVTVPAMGYKPAQDVRCFVDSNFLNRDVEVTLTGHEPTNDILFGDVKSVSNPSYNIIRELLRNGYARLEKDSYKTLEPADHRAAKQAQDEAQQAKLRVWVNWDTERKNASSTMEKDEEFQGRVVEVHSGDSLTVENLKNNEVYRVYLGNVRAPAVGNPRKGDPGKPWAWEAKEFVRNASIGKKVRVEVEFAKKIPVKIDEEATGEEKDFIFVSVILPNDKNLSEQLVAAGLATVTPPRSEDAFTKYMKGLTEAEEEAKKKKVGLHSAKNPINPSKYNDLGQQKLAAKSKQFFELVKNETGLTGVVDAVLSGSLFKIRLDKQNCYILFSLAGIRTYSNEKNVPQYERFAKEALKFSKDNALQREVEINMNSVGKNGVIQGTILVNKKNFAISLVENGLAYVDASSKETQKYAVMYRNIEKTAEEKKIGIWGAGIPVRVAATNRSGATKPISETKVVTVSEVASSDEIYVHLKENKKQLDNIQAELSKPGVAEGKLEQPVKKGIPCIAKFSEDGKWYRARIDKLLTPSKFGVIFTDYGNYDEVSYDNLRKISPSLLAVEPLAKRTGLAYVDAAGNKTGTYEDAAERLRELVWEKEITIDFVYEDGVTKFGIFWEKKTKEFKDSVNFKVVNEGLVRLAEDIIQIPGDQLGPLRDADENARIKKNGGWGAGDFVEDDDY